MPDMGKTIEDLKQLAKDDWILHFNDTDVKETAKAALALLKEQEQTINELKEKLRLLEYGDQDTLQSVMMPAT